MPTLSLHNIHYAYKNTTTPLFAGATLTLYPQEKVGLFGPNGSGKSTLFHIATGLIHPNQGTITFKGHTLTAEKDFQKARLAMGYLLQRSQDQLFCATILEDVAFGPLNQGFSHAQAKEIAMATLEHLAIAHLADRAGCNLSGGERKMAALATILAMQPKILLLDEPTNNLDPESQEKVEQLLQNLTIPFIVVSHEQTFLQTTCTRVMCLSNYTILPHKKL